MFKIYHITGNSISSSYLFSRAEDPWATFLPNVLLFTSTTDTHFMILPERVSQPHASIFHKNPARIRDTFAIKIKFTPGSLVCTENEGIPHQQVAWVTSVVDCHPRKIWRCMSSNVMPIADLGWM